MHDAHPDHWPHLRGLADTVAVVPHPEARLASDHQHASQTNHDRSEKHGDHDPVAVSELPLPMAALGLLFRADALKSRGKGAIDVSEVVFVVVRIDIVHFQSFLLLALSLN